MCTGCHTHLHVIEDWRLQVTLTVCRNCKLFPFPVRSLHFYKGTLPPPVYTGISPWDSSWTSKECSFQCWLLEAKQDGCLLLAREESCCSYLWWPSASSNGGKVVKYVYDKTY